MRCTDEVFNSSLYGSFCLCGCGTIRIGIESFEHVPKDWRFDMCSSFLILLVPMCVDVTATAAGFDYEDVFFL